MLLSFRLSPKTLSAAQSLACRERKEFLITNKRGQFLYFWPHVREIREIPAKGKEDAWIAILIDSSAQGLVLPVPLSAFASQTERREFIAVIQARIRSAQAPEK
ncbi:MAG: hypothetical protein LBD06_01190 [Candidatus Accumulibacter sp.]|jgi:hypothetical protein|nr:hypothetical protein [Accumulibacter sp.]